FLAAPFLAAAFLAPPFLAADFLAVAFFAGPFLAADFFAVAFFGAACLVALFPAAFFAGGVAAFLAAPVPPADFAAVFVPPAAPWNAEPRTVAPPVSGSLMAGCFDGVTGALDPAAVPEPRAATPTIAKIVDVIVAIGEAQPVVRLVTARHHRLL